MKNFVFVDTEYTTFGPTRETGWPELHHHKEIVQIAAVLFDIDSGNEIKGFDILVRPSINPELTKVFSDLTGITQDVVDKNGLSFPEALDHFRKFADGYLIWVFDRDWFVFEENCNLNKVDFPFRDKEFIRVKPQLPGWGIDPEKYSSGTLYEAVGLEMKGHVHNALHDARSMAASVSRLYKLGKVRLC